MENLVSPFWTQKHAPTHTHTHTPVVLVPGCSGGDSFSASSASVQAELTFVPLAEGSEMKTCKLSQFLCLLLPGFSLSKGLKA